MGSSISIGENKDKFVENGRVVLKLSNISYDIPST